MKRIRNSKGFTLVELLVAVAILGIITGMSIPLIRNIQLRNNNKKFEQYGKAMLSSAKLYRDSYDEDLFGRKSSGCALVSLSQLIEKGLIKDYPDENITCDYSGTMVRIVKINKQYGYSYQLFCGTDLEHPSFTYSTFSKREGLFQKNDTTPTEGIDGELEEGDDTPDYGSFGGFDLSSCNMKNSMKIEANPDSGIDKAESYSVKVSLSSTTGISTSSPVHIQYAWVEVPELEETVDDTPIDTSEEDDDPDAEASDEIETVDVEDVEIDYSSITDWKSLQFSKIESEDSQQSKIVSSAVDYITADSHKISPPTDTANQWYLVLKINNFKDLTGEEYPNEYETFGIYNIAKKYTLTYDDNGGNGCSSNKKEFLLGRGESEDWGELCTPERENYVFAGWNTKSDGTGTTITENTPVTSNLKIYAKWSTARVIIRYKLMSNETIAANTSSTATPPVNYKWRRGSGDLVERSTNGGSSYSVLASTLASGKNRELDLANYNNSHFLKITSKAGYTNARSGAEWICESGCKKANQTFSHSKITISDTDNLCDTSHGDCTINIKVNWDSSSITAIPVSLDQQGGSGGTAAIYSKNSKWYNTGNPTTSTSNITTITKPSKTGNTFGGYYSDKNGKGTQKIKADGKIYAAASGVTSSSTWFAKWTLNTCTIKFSPNGGTFNNNANKTTQILQYGKSVSDFWNANGGTYKATRTGYTITSSKAWLLSGTTKTFDETKGYKATQICTSLASKNQTVILKVNWQAKKVAVTLDQQGGSDGTSRIYEYYGIGWYKSSSATSSISKVTIPTRTGYTFEGYYTKKNGAGIQVVSANGTILSGKTTQFSSAGTLYAKWRINVLTIRYKIKSGETIRTDTGVNFKKGTDNYVYKDNKLYTVTLSYNEKLGKTGLTNWHNDKYLYINKVDYNAVDNNEWTDGTNFFDQDKSYKSQELCSNLSKGDCTVTLFVNWRIAYAKVSYHANGGTVYKKYSQPYISIVDGYIAAYGKKRVDKIGSKATLSNAGWGLIDVWNTNYAYIVKDGKRIDHTGGNTWNTKADGTGKTYNQYKTDYFGGDFCDTSHGDCEVILYIRWLS